MVARGSSPRLEVEPALGTRAFGQQVCVRKALIQTAKKVDTFLAVLCLTAETLRVSPPTGPSLSPEALS